ncbi:MAG: group I intron-associated PD-(D/E)XK endonuclease [Bacilli bacterium]
MYLPILEDTKVDCIISKDNYLIKMQIKTLQFDKRDNRKFLPVRKINHNQGEYKIHHYTSNEIDYFVGIDIETDDIYIVPISFSSKYTSSIGLKVLEPYKNNFTQLEPQIGNSLSGCDDIGETLTGNTEGIE